MVTGNVCRKFRDIGGVVFEICNWTYIRTDTLIAVLRTPLGEKQQYFYQRRERLYRMTGTQQTSQICHCADPCVVDLTRIYCRLYFLYCYALNTRRNSAPSSC